MANFLQDQTFVRKLTNYTIGNYQDINALTGLFLAPITQVPVPYGFVQRYDSLAAFATEDATRQPGQGPVTVNWGGKPESYAIQPRALQAPIDQAVLEMTDADTAMVSYESIAKGLVSRVHNNLENEIWTIASGSITHTSGYGTGWSTATGSTPSVNPLSELEALYFDIGKDIGIAPNRIVFGYDAFRYVKQAATSRGSWPIYNADAASMVTYLRNGIGVGAGLECKVAFAGQSNNTGQSTRTITPFVSSKEVWMFYAEPTPDRNDRSAFKTLQFGSGLENLRAYQPPDLLTTYLLSSWYCQPFFANKYAVRKILVS